MASSNVQKRPNGQWRARYRDKLNREHARHFARKADAEAWLQQEMTSLHLGSWTDPRLGRTTFADVAERWLGTVADRKPSTVAGYESILAKHLLSHFGAYAVADVDTTEVRSFVAGMFAAGSSYSTVRNALGVLRQVFRTAVESRLIAASPVAEVRLDRGKGRAAAKKRADERVYLTDAQVHELAEVMPEPYGLLVRFAAYTGLRAGEVAALRVDDLDLEARRVTVARAVKEVHGALVEGLPKNGLSRTVSLPGFLVAELRAYLVATGYRGADLLFRSERGGPLRHSNFYRRTFRPVAERAGMPEGLRFHDLRHTCAALLIAAGAHPKAIQERLGHSSIEVTMDTYGHLYEDADDALAEALEAGRARALADWLRTGADLRVV
ncbi:MAG: site-specific integrase [Acidimicrobiales bacterium]|jgi:integrase|nr:site-specific integrase [Acidimicrobiales bacterium]